MAVLELPAETPSAPQETPPKTRDYSHLQKYKFQAGHAPLNRGGRPKGVKNAQTILMAAAPKLAKAYIKTAMEGSPTLLVDSRKWIMPVEGEQNSVGDSKVLIFLGAGPAPRQLDPSTSPETPLQLVSPTAAPALAIPNPAEAMPQVSETQ